MNCLLVRNRSLAGLVLALATLLCSMALAQSAGTASLTVNVVDHSGEPLQHAVVSLHTALPAVADGSVIAVIDQRQLQFTPTVVAIQAGSSVSFPNHDDVRHHVYSFSHPNAFELKLYHGEDGKYQRFMHPGVVVLGCNIHDGMLGYLRVVDTPLFAGSDESGKLLIEDIVPGTYTMKIWHPDLGTQIVEKSVTLKSGRFGTRQTLDVSGKEPVKLKAAHPLQSLFRD